MKKSAARSLRKASARVLRAPLSDFALAMELLMVGSKQKRRSNIDSFSLTQTLGPVVDAEMPGQSWAWMSEVERSVQCSRGTASCVVPCGRRLQAPPSVMGIDEGAFVA